MDVTSDAAMLDEMELPKPAKTARSLFGDPDLRSILANLSHELCRPLISLRMGFDLLLANGEGPIGRDQRGHVETMVDLCDDLLRLTRSYLDYAGLVQGTRPFSFGKFTVAALICEIDRQFEPVAASRKIAWDCRLEGRDAAITTDVSRCQQIFGNLVANALNYTAAGGEVRVTGEHHDDYWVVIVEDNGAGIPGDQIEHVFEPFYRFGREEHSRLEGSGLGLAICQEMVDQLGGEIRLESVVGRGTRAIVRLPVDAQARSALSRRRN